MTSKPPPTRPVRAANRRQERGSAGRQRREIEARRARLRGRLGWAVVSLASIGLIAIAILSTRAGSASAGPVIDGVECNTNEQVSYHIHQHLTIYDLGRPVTVPQGIGIDQRDNCLYWLHTHATNGVIHVESPSEKRYTLANFLDIWGQHIDKSTFLAHGIAPGRSVRAYVGTAPFGGDPRTIPLTSHALITLEYGPPWIAPSASYAFASGE